MHPAYYVICEYSYEIDGRHFPKGYIHWKPKEQRPIINKAWRRATDSEIDEYIKKTGHFDMRTIIK